MSKVRALSADNPLVAKVWAHVCEDVEQERPPITTDAMGEKFGTTRSSVFYALKRLMIDGKVQVERKGPMRRWLIDGKASPWSIHTAKRATRSPATPTAPPKAVKQRPCLICRKPFLSEHAGHRMCAHCSFQTAKKRHPYSEGVLA